VFDPDIQHASVFLKPVTRSGHQGGRRVFWEGAQIF